MKLIYLAGPITAKTHDEWYENIHRARSTAKELWKLGFSVICPHLNTAFMDGYVDRDAFIQGDLLQLDRSDALVVMPNWAHSAGTAGEIDHAKKTGKPVFFLPGEMRALLDWSGNNFKGALGGLCRQIDGDLERERARREQDEKIAAIRKAFAERPRKLYPDEGPLVQELLRRRYDSGARRYRGEDMIG